MGRVGRLIKGLLPDLAAARLNEFSVPGKVAWLNHRISPPVPRAQAGGLWVAGENWVRRWDGQKWEKDFGPFPWGEQFVTTMVETSKRRVLVGTLLGGLYVLNESGGWFRLSRTNGLAQDWVRCLIEDREHNVWVGTSSGLVGLRERKVVMHDPPDNWEGRPVMAITPRGTARSGPPLKAPAFTDWARRNRTPPENKATPGRISA